MGGVRVGFHRCLWPCERMHDSSSVFSQATAMRNIEPRTQSVTATNMDDDDDDKDDDCDDHGQ